MIFTSHFSLDSGVLISKMSTLASSALSYQNLKMSSTIKDAEEKRVSHREKAMLVYTFQLLVDKGYYNAASSLSKECSLNLEEFSICDNIDLYSVFLEFETFYHLRYQRYPQYFKKAGPMNSTDALLEKMKANPYANRKCSALAKDKKVAIQKPFGNGHQKYAEPEGGGFSPVILSSTSKLAAVKQTMEANLSLAGLPTLISPNDSLNEETKLLKPISALDFPTEDMRVFAETIQKDIVVKGLDTKWDDVIGLEDAKVVLKEALMYSKDFMDFFGLGLTPWKGLLLYGPPGVGKTLLAKAAATECGTTFFNISSSSIVSKWRGDSEKMVKTLFDLARYHSPSTIFFDEFDALGSTRDTVGESDASRRLKSELLQQMDGVLSGSNQQQIFILAATNMPWELDPAVLRRLEKRIYIPMPNPRERLGILKLNIQKIAQGVYETSHRKNSLNFDVDYEFLALGTDCYSGSDLHQIVKETVVRNFRQHYGHQQKIRQLTIKTEDILRVVSSIPPTLKPNVIQKFEDWESSHQLD